MRGVIYSAKSGKPILPQPVQYGMQKRRCFSFSSPDNSARSSSVRSISFAFSSMRCGFVDFGITASRRRGRPSQHESGCRGCFVHHTRHARAVDLERQQDVRRRDLILLCKLLHDRLFHERGLVGTKRRVSCNRDVVLPALCNNILLHAQPGQCVSL